MTMLRRIPLWSLLALLLLGCSNTQPFIQPDIRPDAPLTISKEPLPEGENVATFYVLGDWGTGNDNQRAVANALRNEVNALPDDRETPPFVLGLGDNIYKRGLPRGWDKKARVDSLLDEKFGSIYNNFRYQRAGKADTMVIFHVVNGNHDYGVGVRTFDTHGDVLHMETTAEGRYPHFRNYPVHHDGFEDSDDKAEYDTLFKRIKEDFTRPEALELSSKMPLTIVAIDTQILLDLYKKNDIAQVKRHWNELEKLLKAGQEAGHWTMVIGHHPVATEGRHGGFVPFHEAVLNGPHGIIKLTRPRGLISRLIIGGGAVACGVSPLGAVVIVASLPPLSGLIDKYFLIHPQDTDHPDNRRFQNDLKQILEKYQALYLAGHEHNLQLLQLGESSYQIVSGSAAKQSPVGEGDKTYFSHEALGFVRFDATKDALWIGFYEVEVGDNPTAMRTATFRLTR